VNDTKFLFQLREIFEAELHRLGRWDWFAQSCEKAIAAAAITKDRDPDQIWRITGSSDLRGRASAVLRELWRWREAEAQAVDRPTFHILHNEQLVTAAEQFDRGLSVEFKHLSGGRRERFLAAARRGLNLPDDEWPVFVRKPRPRPTREEEARFRELKTKRDTAAAEMKLDPAILAPKTVLENLAANDAEALGKMMPWQRAALGL
jgi:ribonuclease D